MQAQYMINDPSYLGCKNKECKKYENGKCVISTCSGSIKFHVINIRSDIEFVFFSNGFLKPCLVGRSTPVSFANPKQPLYGHLSSTDSTGTSVSTKLLFLLQIFSVLYSQIWFGPADEINMGQWRQGASANPICKWKSSHFNSLYLFTSWYV